MSKSITKSSAKSTAKVVAAAKHNKGRTSGTNVRGTWIQMFEKNEKLPKNKKMTDEQIQKFMKAEFPGRDSFEFTDVAGVRSVRRGYNRGVFNDGKAPKVQSHQYDNKGEVVIRNAKK